MSKGKGTRPRVYARLRPMFGRDAGGEPLFKVEGGCALEYKKEEGADVSRYTFDKVFDMDSTQESVFAEIGDVALDSLRKGFNSTILAYGQTGSGKTFSMEGHKDSTTGEYTSRGLIPRIFTSVFERFSSDSSVKSFEVSLQFIELYNEQLQVRCDATRRLSLSLSLLARARARERHARALARKRALPRRHVTTAAPRLCSERLWFVSRSARPLNSFEADNGLIAAAAPLSSHCSSRLPPQPKMLSSPLLSSPPLIAFSGRLLWSPLPLLFPPVRICSATAKSLT